MQAFPSRSPVFRQAALDRLSSPEQLDKLVSLTRPAEWLALLTACGLIAAAILWGVTGSIETNVKGDGILVVVGGAVADAAGAAAGRLAAVLVHVDDRVTKGQLLARLEQTDTEHAWHDAQAVLQERDRDYRHRAADNENERAVMEKSFAEQAAALRQVIAAAEQRGKFLTAMIGDLEPLAQRGVVTRVHVWDQRKENAAVDQQLSQARADLVKIEAARQQLIIDETRALTEAERRVSEAQRQVDKLAAELEDNSQVLSPVDGRVTEIKVGEGAVVAAGQPLVSIESAGSGLEIIAFIPPDKGKMVRPGMAARITPSTVRKEEVGTLVGRVLEVSEFPATVAGMRSVLQNDKLVEKFSEQGAPYAARVALQRDSAAPSGYRWSSGEGPPVRLASGTLAEVQVTVREQMPISLVIPTLRRLTGIYQ